MTSFAILVKSHGPDRDYVARLLDSFAHHNVDAVPLYLVVPAADLPAFEPLVRERVTLIREEEFSAHLTGGPVAGFSAGYINQEIVKLCFWETGLADNYLCLDSDAEFVRDFRLSDFMADATTPYTFLTDDAALIAEPAYFAEHWAVREPRLRRIQQEVGLESDRLLTVHGHAVFSATVLRAFAERFLAPRGWDYVDALAIVPLEPSWYTMWLLADRTIPIIVREPVIKTFHNPTQYLDYVLRGLATDDVARGYVGIVLNSNYSRGDGLLSLDEPRSTVVARYETGPTILRAMAARALGASGDRPGRHPR
jgi:hypothetical protein